MVGVVIARVFLGLVCVSSLACATSDAPLPSVQADRPKPIELRFSEFYELPVGRKGLEPTERLLSLRGERVLVRGYMVQEEEPFGGFFMLASLPVTVAERADGPADYLPPATLFVHLPAEKSAEAVAYVREVVEVEGTLELGAKEEPGGRISHVRLVLDDMGSARALGTPLLEGAIEHE